MEFHLTSNTFNENYAVNGGALYLKENNVNNLDKTLIIENNIFNHNTAENFGGALYSKVTNLNIDNAKNNNITNNIAGINGGGLYTENKLFENIFNKDVLYLKNNFVDTVNNDYSSNPSYITFNTTSQKESDHYKFNIYSGDYLPLKFTLYDSYDKILDDITKYYSSITLKVLLIDNTNNNNNMNNDYNSEYSNSNSTSLNLLGNIGSFINGNVQLKKFFNDKSIYILKNYI